MGVLEEMVQPGLQAHLLPTEASEVRVRPLRVVAARRRALPTSSTDRSVATEPPRKTRWIRVQRLEEAEEQEIVLRTYIPEGMAVF
jgi:hypothetical protein